ncbi:hypothetical protein OQA88_7858 [Cercophora sp. LCS_1]
MRPSVRDGTDVPPPSVLRSGDSSFGSCDEDSEEKEAGFDLVGKPTASSSLFVIVGLAPWFRSVGLPHRLDDPAGFDAVYTVEAV